MNDELDGKPKECCRCRIPMVMVSISMDWCDQCGTIWQYHLKSFRSPASKPAEVESVPRVTTTVKMQAKPNVTPVAQSDAAPKMFVIPSGKYAGMKMENLTDETLERVWAGFNGCRSFKVAAVLRAELDRRKRGSIRRG